MKNLTIIIDGIRIVMKRTERVSDIEYLGGDPRREVGTDIPAGAIAYGVHRGITGNGEAEQSDARHKQEKPGRHCYRSQ